MYTVTQNLGDGMLGAVSTDSNGYIVTTSPSDPEAKYASYKWVRINIPYAGLKSWGLSFLICYEDEDGVKHYPYGDSDRYPNSLSSYWFVDPRDNHCFYGRKVYEFSPSMVDAPTLDLGNQIWTPPSGSSLTTSPPTVDIYIQYGSGCKNIYIDREAAIKYDSFGNFAGTNYYVDGDKCNIIYEYGEFTLNSDGELRTNDMPDSVPVLFAENYPDIIWRVDGVFNDGMIYSPLIPNMTILGAFKGVQTLRRVVIPKSCKKIGLASFWGTNLREATISSDCSYAQTSFPDGCIINYYD